jgi:hypothetical protein
MMASFVRASVLAVAVLGLAAGPAHAGCPPPCPPVVLTWVDQPVTCVTSQWRVKQVPCEVMRPVWRVESRVVTCDVPVPEWKDSVQTVCGYRYQPRQVVRDQVRFVLVPCTSVDPCTGCAYTTCKPQPVCEKVSCTVWDCVPELKQVPCKVCVYKTEKRQYRQSYYVCDWKKETVLRPTYECVPVQVTTMRKVPVWVPACP